jgi:hypothetical protein
MLAVTVGFTDLVFSQEKKLDRIRVEGGSASATQMSLWLKSNLLTKSVLDDNRRTYL